MIEVKKSEKAKEIKYPVARKSKFNGEVVVFSGENSGIVVKVGHPLRNTVGTVSENWTSLTNESTWEPVDVHISG
ncbi:hypothetical protein [Snodgrassella alvi]|jgi:hypothetical protein|uniref:Uncharacterized protein n=1 Tax=Snodgrassella alvi TaxID=1196083 RepID=A0A855G2T6_9NEIS|nr:hypothetical protein [Snodgrassella alvi]PIT11655.1 hypothetical protein BGI30_04025 [Snodgrassella alvi]PIT55299.1 hypothetical protein BHC59_11095 [Snodgrassella alvi]PIT62563.1 hypothetical protein BHC57_01125 [Snodgrassella alvi]